jgi:hypothetical protein
MMNPQGKLNNLAQATKKPSCCNDTLLLDRIAYPLDLASVTV